MNAKDNPSETPPSQAPAKPPGRGSLAVLFLAVFIDLLGFGIVLPLLPIYADQFAEEHKELLVGLLFASFSGMQFLFAPVWGRISDSIGRRPVLMIGLAGSVIFYAVFGLATVWRSVTWLFVARIGAGICGATIGTAQAYIADSTPHQERSRGMALIGAAFGLGFTLGPLFAILALTGASTDSAGNVIPSGGPGYAAAGLSLIALVLAYFKLPESYQPEQRASSRRSASHKSWIDPEALRLARSIPSLGLLVLASFVVVFAFANFETTLALLLRREEGKAELAIKTFDFELWQVCLAFAYIGFILVLTQGGLVRRMARKHPERHLASGGVVVSVIGNGLLIYAGYAHSTFILFVGLALVVSGFAFITPSVNSLISRRSPPEKQGVILGLLQSANALARIVGPMVGVPLIYRTGYGPFALAIFAMLGGGAMIIFAARRGEDYQAEEKEKGVGSRE